MHSPSLRAPLRRNIETSSECCGGRCFSFPAGVTIDCGFNLLSRRKVYTCKWMPLVRKYAKPRYIISLPTPSQARREMDTIKECTSVVSNRIELGIALERLCLRGRFTSVHRPRWHEPGALSCQCRGCLVHQFDDRRNSIALTVRCGTHCDWPMRCSHYRDPARTVAVADRTHGDILAV